MRMLLDIHEYEELEREGRLPAPAKYVPTKCAGCGNTENLTGQEDTDVYDGVCIWHCPCGARTNRWTGELL